MDVVTKEGQSACWVRYEAPKRFSKGSMRVNGVDSANAGADGESKPPAFQIIVLVRMYKHSTINSPN